MTIHIHNDMLSATEEENCLALVNGKANPSDFGYTFEEAITLLKRFVVPIKNLHLRRNLPESVATEANELLSKAYALMGNYEKLK